MPLAFKNEETSKRYKCLVDTDRLVHKAGVYSGLLSAIHPGMAAAMVRQKSNLLEEIAAPQLSAEQTIEKVNAATSVAEIDEIIKGDTRTTVVKAAEKAKKALV